MMLNVVHNDNSIISLNDCLGMFRSNPTLGPVIQLVVVKTPRSN